MKDAKKKVSIKSIDYRYFSGIRKLCNRRPAPDAQSVIDSGRTLKVKEGFVVENWTMKTRPVSYVRRFADGRFSERRLPEVGSYAILRTK